MGRRKKPKPDSTADPVSSTSKDAARVAPGKRIRGYVIVIAFALTATLAWVATPSIVASRWARKGEAALVSRQLNKANTFFDRAREWSKRDGTFALRKARIARLNADAQAARDWIELAIDEGCSIRLSRREETLLRVQGGRASEMIDQLPVLIGADEDDAAAVLEAYAVGFSAIGDNKTAIELLDRWLKQQPEAAIAYVRKGQILFDQELFPQAEKLFVKALQIHPELLEARLALARTAYALEKDDQALHYYQQVAHLDPANLDARLSAASLLMRFKQPDRAVTQFKSILAEVPNNFTARLELGSHYVKHEQPASAIEMIAPLMTTFADDVALNYLMATAYEQLGNRPEFESHMRRYFDGRAELDRLVELQKYAEADPSDFQIRKEMGLGFLRLEWASADQWLQQAQTLNPNDANLFEALAEVAQKGGDWVQAGKYRSAAIIVRQRSETQDHSQVIDR